MHEKLQQNRGRTFFAWCQGLDEVSLELEIGVDMPSQGFEIRQCMGASMVSLPSGNPAKKPTKQRWVPELTHHSDFGGGR
jgi:hypothetical protein